METLVFENVINLSEAGLHANFSFGAWRLKDAVNFGATSFTILSCSANTEINYFVKNGLKGTWA